MPVRANCLSLRRWHQGGPMAYYNFLRIRGSIVNLCLTIARELFIERELFGPEPLSEIHGEAAGGRLRNRSFPADAAASWRCHRMMMRALRYLDERRSRIGRAKKPIEESRTAHQFPANTLKMRVPGRP